MRHRRPRRIYARRITEAERSTSEEAYLRSLRSQRVPVTSRQKDSQGMSQYIERMEPVQQQNTLSPKKRLLSKRFMLGCLAICIIFAVGLLFNILFVQMPASTISTVPVVTPSPTIDTAGSYCSAQACIPNKPSFPSGSSYTVECRDGWYSHAGGQRGACSHHGGEYP